MKYLFRTLICAMLCWGTAQAQLQTAHWYFGRHAGVDFSSGIPVSDNNGQIDTNEGSTSISDEYGNLLFYTDGETVYNRNHQIMENGNDLGGHRSSTTSAIILPKPDDCFLYYVFTVDVQPGESGQGKGIEYNIVDMSLNGGFGAVIEKNIQLPVNGQQNGYEKLAAISNAENAGYWVLTHFEGQFYAFEVTADGVNHNPIVSPSSINPPVLPDDSYAVGYIKGSPDGSKLGMGMVHDSYNAIIGSLSLYDFDNSTGIVSNEIILYPPGNPSGYGFYAIEFSADSKALYTKTFKNASLSKILQFDMTAASIINSEYTVSNTPMLPNAMQRALDGNIYISTPATYYLARIENPEIIYNSTTGAAPTYTPNAVQLGGLSSIGLPTFLNHYFRISITVNGLSIIEELEYCTGIGIDFDFCHQGGIIESIHWDFGDGTESNEMYPYHYYNAPGTYTITLTLIVEGEEYIRTFEITMMGPEDVYNAEQEICINEGEEHTFNLEDSLDEIYPGDADYNITFHLTQQEAENNQNPQGTLFTTGQTTIIWIRAEDENNCFVIRELNLIVNYNPVVEIESPVEVCGGTNAVLEVTTQETNTVNWYDSETSTTPVFTGNPFETPELTDITSYWVEIISDAGCISERTEVIVEISETIVPVFDIIQEYCINAEEVELPPVSDNGITGSWLPAIIDTSVLGISVYTFTPDEGQCSEEITLEIEITESIIPSFDLQSQYCLNSIPDELPSESGNGITGSWFPQNIDTGTIGTTTYTFTPDAGQCSEEINIEIEITDNIVPIFDLQTQYCLNSIPDELPAESDNGITGNWSPTVIDTTTIGTTTYTFTPHEEQCSEPLTVEIEITETTNPEFDLPTQYCTGAIPDILHPTSDNNITGTWFPSTINTATAGTQIYTFTPDEGQCAQVFELEVEILETQIPEFNLQTLYCIGSIPGILPPTSDNGITGSWLPASIDTSAPGIQVYTFTPETDCGEIFTLEVEVTQEITPEFNLQTQYCLDTTPNILPSTSDNNITGTWFPAQINTGTTGTQIYTFTPEMECAAEFQIEITISETITPEFTNLPVSYCLDTEPETLSSISDNGIAGNWFPSTINTSIQGTTIYTFTPGGSQCSEEFQMTVTVYPHPEMDMEEKIVICEGDSFTYSAPDGFDSYLWTNQQNQVISNTQTVIFTQEGLYTLTVEINGIPCQLSRNIEVSFSEPPVITEIKTTENTLTVYAQGGIPMEYSLNQVFWQSSPIFTNLQPGIYYAYVRDAEGCSTAAKMAGLLGVPNFISPNGDGYNDTWEIRALEAFPNTRLQIFDRYGKQFVNRVLTGDFKWDGKYNGQPLPSGSYWYILILENGEKLSGHINIRNGKP